MKTMLLACAPLKGPVQERSKRPPTENGIIAPSQSQGAMNQPKR